MDSNHRNALILLVCLNYVIRNSERCFVIIKVGAHEDYPIMYGNSSDARCRAVHLQCGRQFRTIPDKEALFDDFRMGGIGFNLKVKLDVLQQCIREGSNAPYWDGQAHNLFNNDLRNPKYRKNLERVCKQFGLSPSQLIK